MGFGGLLVLAVGLSMDAFAVSVCKGLAMGKTSWKAGMTCGVWFGGFQALMPLLGFFLGAMFADAIATYDHWVAFGLLAIIGVNMLKEAGDCDCCCEADFSFRTMLIMAVATSIDALAVGISLAMAGKVNIFLAVSLIGAVTCGLSTLGVKLGGVFGAKYEKKAQIAGGVILILIGTNILLEHLGVLS